MVFSFFLSTYSFFYILFDVKSFYWFTFPYPEIYFSQKRFSDGDLLLLNDLRKTFQVQCLDSESYNGIEIHDSVYQFVNIYNGTREISKRYTPELAKPFSTHVYDFDGDFMTS